MQTKIKTRVGAALAGLALTGGLMVASAPDAHAYKLNVQVFGVTKSNCLHKVSATARNYSGPYTYVGHSGCSYHSSLGKWTANLWFD